MDRQARQGGPIALFVRQDIQVFELADHLFFPAAAYPLHHAGMQVALQQDGFHLFDGPAHRVGLLQDVHAVFVLFQHFPDTGKVTFDIAQSLQGLGFGFRQNGT